MKNTIPEVSSHAFEAFNKFTPLIIEKVIERTISQNNIISIYGNTAKEKFSAGIEWTAKMLKNAMAINEPKLLVEQLQWAKTRLPVDNIKPEYVLSMLKNYQDVINEILPIDDANEINKFVEMMLKKQIKLMDE